MTSMSVDVIGVDIVHTMAYVLPMTYIDSVLATVADVHERALLRTLWDLGSALDAHHDGASHAAMDHHAADAYGRKLDYDYGRAMAALSDHRDAQANR